MGRIRISRDDFRYHANKKDRERGEPPIKDAPLEEPKPLPYMTIVDDTKGGWQEPNTVKKIKKTTHEAIQKVIANTPRITERAKSVTALRGMDDWPEEDVWRIIWNATERQVRAHPAYHVALLRQAQKSEGAGISVEVTRTEPPKPGGDKGKKPGGPKPVK